MVHHGTVLCVPTANSYLMEQTIEALGLLSRRRRLIVLSVLKERGGAMSMDELATAVALEELGVPRSNLTDEQRERVRLSLHHVHFPQLLDANLLERAPDGERVRLAEESADVRRIVDVVFED